MEDKTMKKVFGIAALLLVFVACNKIETEITPIEQPSDSKGITITATLAPKTAVTKAVADNGDNKITASWAVGERIFIMYEIEGEQMVTIASIIAVDSVPGSAAISFFVDPRTADNTPCTLVYPLAAANATLTGVKDAATLLSAQDGKLSANLDVRVGEGTIQTTTPSLDVTKQPAAQFAIFKFTVRGADGTTAISAKPLKVTIGTQDYVITPAAATDVLYAVLPAVSGEKVSFDATDGSGRTYTCAKLSASFEAGKYYQSTLKMREYVDLGIVVGGKKIKWATCNVGAANPQDYGDYFAWGATVPFYAEGHSQDDPCNDWISGKTGYNWTSYPFMLFRQSNWSYITKYTVADDRLSGIWYDGGGNFIGDNKTVLDFADDAARANWGGSWRMPTYAEMEELLALSREWVTYEGVKGYRFTGSNGKTLFLPAAGYRDNVYLYDAGIFGLYWSSSLSEDLSVYARGVLFYDTGIDRGYEDRRYGRSVRPVTD